MDYNTAVSLQNWLNDVFMVNGYYVETMRVILAPDDERHKFWHVDIIDLANNRSIITFHEAVVTNYLNLGLEIDRRGYAEGTEEKRTS